MLKIKMYLLPIIAVVFFAGCAARSSLEETLLIYPPPPDEPRVVYLRSHRGEGDYVKRGFLDFIFGAPRVPSLPKAYGVYASGDKIYAALTGGAVVAVIDPIQKKVSYIGYRGAGKLVEPIGVAGSADGTIFVSDSKQKKIFGYDANGSLRIAIGNKDEFQNPAGLAVNNELGRLYVVDSYGHRVRVFSVKGEPLFQFGRNGSGDGEFHFPSNIAIDRRNGNVYVVDTMNFRIQVFDKDGKFLKKFGEIGDRPGNFSRPKGIGVDSEGHVYVVDAAFDNFQILDENGTPLLFIGSAGTEPGYFQLPAGLYIDEKDRIYITDSMNGRIQVFQYLSEKWKKENPEVYKKYQFTGQ